MKDNLSWIKLFRKFRDWCWYHDGNTKDLFIELLLSANTEDKRWEDVIIKRGQLVTSMANLAKELKITRQQVRTSLLKLKSTNEITSQTNNHYTLITVVNYIKYQGNNQPFNQPITNQQPTDNQPITTTKEYKNIRNINTCPDGQDFLAHFNKESGGKNYTLTDKRKKLLTLREKTFSLEQIKKAVTQMFKQDFYCGINDRRWTADPDYFLRDDEQIDKFLNSEIKSKEITL